VPDNPGALAISTAYQEDKYPKQLSGPQVVDPGIVVASFAAAFLERLRKGARSSSCTCRIAAAIFIAGDAVRNKCAPG
jgi:hypothetical protein